MILLLIFAGLARLTYILCGVCLANAIFLDLMFWAFLANGFGGFINISVHLMNAVFILGDVLLNNVQLLPVHVWYGFTYALLYLIWVWAWYLWVSRDRRTDEGWIYPFLNWNQAGWPIFYFGIPVRNRDLLPFICRFPRFSAVFPRLSSVFPRLSSAIFLVLECFAGWIVALQVFWTSTYAVSSWSIGKCKRVQQGTEEGGGGGDF